MAMALEWLCGEALCIFYFGTVVGLVILILGLFLNPASTCSIPRCYAMGRAQHPDRIASYRSFLRELEYEFLSGSSGLSCTR
jgi:hypothetical protein